MSLGSKRCDSQHLYYLLSPAILLLRRRWSDEKVKREEISQALRGFEQLRVRKRRWGLARQDHWDTRDGTRGEVEERLREIRVGKGRKEGAQLIGLQTVVEHVSPLWTPDPQSDGAEPASCGGIMWSRSGFFWFDALICMVRPPSQQGAASRSPCWALRLVDS